MRKKIKVLILALLAIFILISVVGSRSDKGTIKEFIDDAVIVALDDEKAVTRIEDYHRYIPTGEQWSVGDKVKIRYGFFNDLRILRIYRLTD